MPPYPKIELHVHLEATIKPERLLEIARRNGEQLPADTVEGIRALRAIGETYSWPAPETQSS
jgi:adenosine deaminase